MSIRIRDDVPDGIADGNNETESKLYALWIIQRKYEDIQ